MRVALVTPSSFRNVNAGAIRNATVANALALSGAQVTVVSADSAGDEVHPTWTQILDPAVALEATGPLRTRGVNQVRRLLGAHVERGIRFVHAADAVIIYNPDPFGFGRAVRATAGTATPVIVDMSEWLGPGDLPGRRLSPYSWCYERFMRTLPPRTEAGIAISTAMAAHLGATGTPVLVLPPLHPPPNRTLRPRTSNKISLLVTGSGFVKRGKDLATLNDLALAFELQPALSERIVVHVAGRFDPLGRLLVQRLRASVEVVLHDWLDWSESIRLLEEVDWLVQFRDEGDRRARYGFPSKVTEALVHGTPVLANSFSDVGLLVRHGVDGIVLNDRTPHSIAEALRDASVLALDRAKITSRATKVWTARGASDDLTEFVESAINRRKDQLRAT